jgi:hypothetical protein
VWNAQPDYRTDWWSAPTMSRRAIRGTTNIWQGG